MNKVIENTNIQWRHFIEKYLGQENTLPAQIRDWVEKECGVGSIQIYALADLNGDLKFDESWLILTKDRLTIAGKTDQGYEVTHRIQLSEISKLREIQSLSGTTWTIVKSDDLPPMATIRFTHRQKISMQNLKYLLELDSNNEENQVALNFDPDEEYVRSVAKPVVDAQNSMTSDDAGTLLRLLKYMLPYKRELLQGLAGAVLATTVGLIPGYLSGYAIDKVVKPFQDGIISSDEALSMAWIMVAAIAAIYGSRELFMWLRLNRMSVLGEKIARDLRDELYSHLQKLSLDFYSKKQTGSIISRVSSDTDRIWDFVAFGVIEVFMAIITLTGLSAVLISLDLKLGLIVSLPVPLLLMSIYWHGETMKKLFLKAWRKWSNMTAVLSDTIPGIQVVKAFNQERKEAKRFMTRNAEITEEFNNIHRSWTNFWPKLMIGVAAITVTVWGLAIPRMISTDGSAGYLSAGTFVSFMLYMTMFVHPIEIIGQVARMLNRALSSAYRIFEVLDANPTIQQPANPVRIGKVKGDVSFEKVSFSYDGVRPILQKLSFEVKAGEMIGLVGSSGGGKSTITKLIARFYDVDEGEILIDGKNLKTLDLGAYRRQVGMVLQEPFLFHGTIWENIAYGNPDATKKEVIDAAKIANAHDFIGKLPHGYDSIIGERGHDLSGGEKQRVSIARAVLANPRILILDEATSAVDTETEFKIQEALDRLVQGRTVFAVAHRLSTLRKANRILVVKKGQIVEDGTHLKLMEKEKGEYRKLYELQHARDQKL